MDRSLTKLHRFANVYQAPDYVKNASRDELYGDDSLPPECFADRTKRRYAIHSPAACWLSYTNWLEDTPRLKSANHAVLGERILHAAGIFNVQDQLEGIKKSFTESLTKSAKTNKTPHAVIWTDNKGNQQQQLPLRNDEEVKAAAAYLEKYRNEFPRELRQNAAKNVLARARELDLALVNRTKLEQMTKASPVQATKVAKAIRSRVAFSRCGPGDWSPRQAALLKLANRLTEADAQLTESQCEKIAAAIEATEIGTKNAAAVKRGELPPVDEIFVQPEPVDEGRLVKLANGDCYRKPDLEKVIGIMHNPEDFAKQAADASYETATTLRNALAACGVVPTSQSGTTHKLSRAALLAWAAS